MAWITFTQDTPGYAKGYCCDVSEVEAKRLVAEGVAMRGRDESASDEPPSADEGSPAETVEGDQEEDQASPRVRRKKRQH